MRRAMAKSGRAGGSGRPGEWRGWYGFVVGACDRSKSSRAPFLQGDTRLRDGLVVEPEDQTLGAQSLDVAQFLQEVVVEQFAVSGLGAAAVAAVFAEVQRLVVVEGQQFVDGQPGMGVAVDVPVVGLLAHGGADVVWQTAR